MTSGIANIISTTAIGVGLGCIIIVALVTVYLAHQIGISGWSLLIIALPLLLLCGIVAYGIPVGTARFLIGRGLQYYSFDEDALFYLRLVAKRIRWKNVINSWFIREALLQIERSKSDNE